jgi:RNA ligase (TIGR02306 family)
MSTLQVTVEQVRITPHPNADRLALAQVGLYRAVVGKGQFQDGDYALYIPEQAVLPPELIEELGLTGKLAGKEKNRVKAVRLRGELSQGIVCRPELVAAAIGATAWKGRAIDTSGVSDPESYSATDLPDYDFAELLGITKWVPPIPTQMAGKVYPADRLLRWVEIENIKRYPDIFAPGDKVVATEKIHGTCFLLTFDATDEGSTFAVVSSKGYGSKGLAIERDAHNLYWRAVNAYSLEAFAAEVAYEAGVRVVGLFGEVYGGGVQDLAYGINVAGGAPGFALFDIALDVDGSQVFLSPVEFRMVVDIANRRLLRSGVLDEPVATAPVLYEGPYDEAVLLELAEGNSTLDGAQNIREGLVVRPVREEYSPVTGGRKIGKIVGAGYLTRGGDATEYE